MGFWVARPAISACAGVCLAVLLWAAFALSADAGPAGTDGPAHSHAAQARLAASPQESGALAAPETSGIVRQNRHWVSRSPYYQGRGGSDDARLRLINIIRQPDGDIRANLRTTRSYWVEEDARFEEYAVLEINIDEGFVIVRSLSRQAPFRLELEGRERQPGPEVHETPLRDRVWLAGFAGSPEGTAQAMVHTNRPAAYVVEAGTQFETFTVREVNIDEEFVVVFAEQLGDEIRLDLP